MWKKEIGGPRHMALWGLSSLTQDLNQDLLHCRWILHWLSYQGSPLPSWVSFFLCVLFCLFSSVHSLVSDSL